MTSQTESIREQVPLAPLTTYKLGGPARWFADVDSTDEVLAASRFARERELSILVLGRGSNVVVADRGYDGLVIRPGPGLAKHEIVGDTMVAGAAAPLPMVARASARAARGGLEFFAGIPGSVGGAVVMNAGCHGSETAEWLITATVLSLDDGTVEARTAGDLDLAYRHSNLGEDDFVAEARFRTVERPRQEAEAAIREITRWRREHQPGGTLNAGSAFKNPPGDAAGRIIDELGLKGLAVGDVAVSERHANFIVAGEDATAADLATLVDEVRRRVREAVGVDLEPEMRFVGDFG